MWLLTPLQSVNVLSVHPEQLALIVKQPNEVVREVGFVIARIQLFGKCEERVGIVMEVIYFKYGLSIREIVLLEVVIKTTARRSGGEIRLGKGSKHLKSGLETIGRLPEVWDSTGCADTCTCHHHDPFEPAFSDICRNVLQGLLLSSATGSSKQAS